MSSFVHRSLIAAAAAAILAGSAGAQLLPGVGLPMLPPVNLPTRNVPVVGPTLQNILAEPGASEVVVPDAEYGLRPAGTHRGSTAGHSAGASSVAAARTDAPASS